MDLDPFFSFRVPEEISKLLWQFVADPTELFYFSADTNQICMLEWVLKNFGVPLHVQEAALNLAAGSGCSEVVGWIQEHCEIENRDCAFINACAFNHIHVLNLLSRYDFSAKIKSAAFWEAAQSGHISTVKWFLEQYSPNPEMFCAKENNYAFAPLQTVARKGYVDILEYIVKRYDLHAQHIMVEYLIVHAMAAEQVGIVEWIINYFQRDPFFFIWWGQEKDRAVIVEWLQTRRGDTRGGEKGEEISPSFERFLPDRFITF